MRTAVLVSMLLVFAATAHAQTTRGSGVKPPVLKNRAEILSAREAIAQRLLKPGDSVMVRVYIYVNEKGETLWPEIKESSGNVHADTAAINLVRKMVWQPAQNTDRGVMLTVPVKFVRRKPS